MYDNFEALPEEKKKKIIECCLDEFAQYGYERSSTNRIVGKAGISKGSLFNYFNTKEELFFYIFGYAVNIITKEMSGKTDNLPGDLFSRIYTIASLEYDIYLEKPKLYKLFKKALTSDNKELLKKIKERYALQSNNVFNLLLGEFKNDNLSWEKERIINIVKWVLEGLNEEFLDESMAEVEESKEEYLKELKIYLKMLQEGLVE